MVFAAFLQRFCSDFSVQLSSGETVPSPGIPASKSIMAPGERHQAHPFFEVAAAGQQVEGFFYEGLRVQRDQVGLVLVDALVVGRGFHVVCRMGSRHREWQLYRS